MTTDTAGLKVIERRGEWPTYFGSEFRRDRFLGHWLQVGDTLWLWNQRDRRYEEVVDPRYDDMRGRVPKFVVSLDDDEVDG